MFIACAATPFQMKHVSHAYVPLIRDWAHLMDFLHLCTREIIMNTCLFKNIENFTTRIFYMYKIFFSDTNSDIFFIFLLKT